MKRQKRNLKPVVWGAALAITLTLGMPGLTGAEETAAPQPEEAVSQPAATGVLPADDVPLLDVEVKDTKARPAPDGSAANGYRATDVNIGPLGKRTLLDTPYTISVIPGELMKNMLAESAADALKYSPAVQSGTGGSRVTDYYVIRGITSSIWTSNVAVDGLRGTAVVEPIEDKDRIEVMSGTSSFLYGVTSPGGMINYVLKRPTNTPLEAVTLGNYGGSQGYIRGDFGGPAGKDGKFAYRLNVLGVTGGDTGIDKQKNKRSLVSGAFDWHPNPNTVWSFDVSHFERDLEYAQAFYMRNGATSIPSAPDASINWGSPYSFARDRTDRIGTSFTAKLDDTLTLRAAYRYSDVEREYSTYRRRLVNGSPLVYTPRVDYQGAYHTIANQGSIFLDKEFKTGKWSHKLTLGWMQDLIETQYPAGSAGSYTSSTQYLLADSGYPPNPVFTYSTTPSQKVKYQSLLLADQLTFSKTWSMIVGGNYASIDDRSWNSATGVSSGTPYNESKFTPSVSVLYKPKANVTVYASYLEALQKGLVSTTAGNLGEVFAPYVSKQLELGAKAKLGGVDVSAALFRINQAGQYTDSATQISTQDGRNLYNGGEVIISGKVNKNLTLVGGFTQLNAKVDKTSTADLLNKTPQGVAKSMARLFAEYDLPSVPGLTLIGGISYTGKQWVDAANTVSIPAVVVGDVGVRYNTKINGQDITFRLMVDNITDKNYWTTRSDLLYLGNPRTVAFSAELQL
ncbi:MAG TPA: TonB-dependent receptor [Methylomusa anaerophila]|uniref:Ferrichrome receptor FcuA n=1 Tax=Methylomusa anaerophila TaxID=1930071 RepID=A0A348AFF3_9FIRM|nr:TonB-dependent receptor [Methylomusa anaerophila]BBB89801.1 ferrichrome receptor FcuA precursor [Methylomusa anaerophila]HML89152.1 TonB-dependent receptor [Methylomusa anaerophila]